MAASAVFESVDCKACVLGSTLHLTQAQLRGAIAEMALTEHEHKWMSSNASATAATLQTKMSILEGERLLLLLSVWDATGGEPVDGEPSLEESLQASLLHVSVSIDEDYIGEGEDDNGGSREGPACVAVEEQLSSDTKQQRVIGNGRLLFDWSGAAPASAAAVSSANPAALGQVLWCVLECVVPSLETIAQPLEQRNGSSRAVSLQVHQLTKRPAQDDELLTCQAMREIAPTPATAATPGNHFKLLSSSELWGRDAMLRILRKQRRQQQSHAMALVSMVPGENVIGWGLAGERYMFGRRWSKQLLLVLEPLQVECVSHASPRVQVDSLRDRRLVSLKVDNVFPYLARTDGNPPLAKVGGVSVTGPGGNVEEELSRLQPLDSRSAFGVKGEGGSEVQLTSLHSSGMNADATYGYSWLMSMAPLSDCPEVHVRVLWSNCNESIYYKVPVRDASSRRMVGDSATGSVEQAAADADSDSQEGVLSSALSLRVRAQTPRIQDGIALVRIGVKNHGQEGVKCRIVTGLSPSTSAEAHLTMDRRSYIWLDVVSRPLQVAAGHSEYVTWRLLPLSPGVLVLDDLGVRLSAPSGPLLTPRPGPTLFLLHG